MFTNARMCSLSTEIHTAGCVKDYLLPLANLQPPYDLTEHDQCSPQEAVDASE